MSDEYADDYDGPSKSQLKREDAELESLARQLTGLRKAAQADLPAGSVLRDALAEWHRIRSHEARRRHLRRLVRLIREDDVDTLRRAADRLSPDSALSMALTRRAERWSDRLCAEPTTALTAFIDEHPDVDTQRLRQLQRRALADAGNDDPPSRAQRELLKCVREALRRSAN